MGAVKLMLDDQIERERRNAVQAILGAYGDLYLPHAMLVPSARFGLYAAAKTLFFPGDCVLISPITCRTVIHALLAAGVTPVFVDIELATGNIDVSRLSKATLGSARAIVTTNLYGNPDAVHDLASIARSRNLLLIEDCAHVLQTRLAGQEIGSFGDVSVFSFKKHFDEFGGVICVRNKAAAAKIQDTITTETTLPPTQEERLRYCQFRLTEATGPKVVRHLSSVYRLLRKAGANHDNNLRPSPLDSHQKPVFSGSMPTTATLLRMVNFLRRRQELIQSKISVIRNLIEHCTLPPRSNGSAEEVLYLAVPFFSAERDEIVAKLWSRSIPTYFMYTPPMSTLFRGRTRLISGFDQNRIDIWCRNILPVLPQFGPQFLEALGRGTSLAQTAPACMTERSDAPPLISIER